MVRFGNDCQTSKLTLHLTLKIFHTGSPVFVFETKPFMTKSVANYSNSLQFMKDFF